MGEKLEGKLDINRSLIIGEAIHQYEALIKPALKRGSLEGARLLITNLNINSQFVKGISLNPKEEGKDEVSSYYRGILAHLNYLVARKGGIVYRKLMLDKKEMSSVLLTIDKEVEKLDVLLKNDSSYMEVRKVA